MIVTKMGVHKKAQDFLYHATQNGHLFYGDCLEIMAHVEDKSIDLILCDLPYGTTRCKWDVVIPFDALWKEYERIIKDNGVILLFSQAPFDKLLACSNLKLFRYEWIWEKTQATGHLNAKRMPMKAHETILVFYKKMPTYNPIKTTGHIRKTASAKSKIGNRNNLYGNYKLTDYDSTERFPRSILHFPSDKQIACFHPTQKPVDLLAYFIQTYTNKGNMVLDNTSGSGTLAVACEQLDRQWICIEKEKEYCDITVNRLSSIQPCIL